MTYTADDDKELVRDLKATIATLAELNDRRAGAPERGMSREDSRKGRLRAMKMAWEKRGRPWDEAEALRMIYDLEQRGETRVTRWR